MEEKKFNNEPNSALHKVDVMCALPCPFCGSDTEIETTTFGDSMIDYFRVNCKQKGHSLDWWSNTIDEAILVWNERQ